MVHWSGPLADGAVGLAGRGALWDGGWGPSDGVASSAVMSWYRVVDLLQEQGATVRLTNPKALNWGDRRVKNDVIDATDQADILRLGPCRNDLRTVCRVGSCQRSPQHLAGTRTETRRPLDSRTHPWSGPVHV
jgi:hypothetical protein